MRVIRESHSTSPHEAPAPTALDDYAGSFSCRGCHREVFEQWAKSHHALAERNVSVDVDEPAFVPPRKISHGKQISHVREQEGKFQLITAIQTNHTDIFNLTRAIGVQPLRQYLAPAVGGRFQATELAFDPARKDWFNIFDDEDRRPGEWGHWTGRGMTWNTMCANCHNTGLQKNYDAVSDSYQTAMAEAGVSCEACHGPMRSHAQWHQKNFHQPKKDPTIRDMSRDQFLDACGSCHARRSELTGDFVPGNSFHDHFNLSIPDETDIFYPDGQVREEDYEFTSFLSSKMHAAGVRCVDCHNPHSGKIKLPGNALCLQCHSGTVTNAPRIDFVAHSFHKPNTLGSFCVDCHMPQTTYMQRHARRDHGFTIPDPLLTKQHGVPNACNRCHQDKSVDWALENAEKWYGPKMDRSTCHRAQLLAQARSDKTDVAEQLVGALRDEKIPLWCASIINLLRPSIAAPKVTQTLLSRVSDSHPLVRTAVARAIAPLTEQKFAPAETALRALLNDPVRLVRIDAAWALRETLDTNTAAGADLMAYLSHNADQPAGALQLGHFFLSRDDLEQAIFWFQRAVSWNQYSAPLRHDYAVALNLSGKNNQAISQLEEACRLAPNEPEYLYKLALALHEAGNLRRATTALEQTVKLDPQFSRAWYNLGLAYAAANRLDEAVKTLEEAERIDTRSAEIPYARATVLARMSLMEEARSAARLALQRDPQFVPASEFLR